MLVRFSAPTSYEEPVYVSKHLLEDISYFECDEVGEMPVTVMYFMNGQKVIVKEEIEEVKKIILEKEIPKPVPHNPAPIGPRPFY